MSINVLTLYGDEEVSLADLAAIVLCGREYLLRVGGGCAVQVNRAAIALQYVVEGEHVLMSSTSFCCS